MKRPPLPPLTATIEGPRYPLPAAELHRRMAQAGRVLLEIGMACLETPAGRAAAEELARQGLLEGPCGLMLHPGEEGEVAA